ncbi:MAG: extracellular solute-binding protein [Acidaminococcaceae bacterium]|nr:extracellular solute-binding protein [Acidaminococcaceae bacterium]
MSTIKYLFLICICLLFLVAAGCGSNQTTGSKKTVQVYTTLDKGFVEALCEKYTDSLPKDNKIAFVVLNKDSEWHQADCIISEATLLQQKTAGGSLQIIKAEFADLLPEELKGTEEKWITLFYDPAVLLVNQAYSRKVGQQRLLHWSDLPKQTDAKIVMENLSDNESTIMFLAAMSSRMGQNEFLTFFKQIRPMIKQYAKFPITPVRMAATGDADIAVTRRSHVFRYLQNDFPAYILIPDEGTPVNLYGIGLLQNSKMQKEVVAFVNWLLKSSEARTVLMTTRSGYLPVLPKGEKGQAVNMDTLWTNTFYKNNQALEKLTGDWLREIRLTDAGEDVK